MKKIIFLLLPASLLFACASNDSTVKGTSDSTGTNKPTAENDNVSLPFSMTRTPDWEINNRSNVAVAMNCLKAFIDNDMTAIGQYLADSVEFYTDNVEFKGTRDSLVKFFTPYRNRLDSVTIRMHDYESVKSKSRGEEWVGMWYTETMYPKGGVADSSMVMDDIKIVNGKVAIIDSKGRRLVKK